MTGAFLLALSPAAEGVMRDRTAGRPGIRNEKAAPAQKRRSGITQRRIVQAINLCVSRGELLKRVCLHLDEGKGDGAVCGGEIAAFYGRCNPDPFTLLQGDHLFAAAMQQFLFKSSNLRPQVW